MEKKHGNVPLIVLIIGFVIGVLIGRGLEWDFDGDEDDGQ